MFGKKKKKEKLEVQTEEVQTEEVKTEEVQDEEIQVKTELKDRVLYIVMDKEIHGVTEYMRGLGLDVYAVHNSIEDVRDPILMATDPSRLAIIETGTGILTSTKSREQLLDIIGMQDEDTEITVFYTDDTIKRDAQRHLGKGTKGVDWVVYKSTLDVVAKLLQYRENYILDDYCQIEEEKSESEIWEYKGLAHEVRGEDPKVVMDREELRQLVNAELGSIEAFEVNM